METTGGELHAGAEPKARPDVRTPVSVVTGFLGTGKTSLINQLLTSPSMQRTAVVVNEFGEIGLDHLLIASSNDNIVVLENGCLCCTVFGDLIETLNRLYHSREAGEIPAFDRVVIETSGLADPRPILQAFLSDPTLEGLYRLESAVVTLDAVNGPATLDSHRESVHQLAIADFVMLTKLDLLGEDAEAKTLELTARVARINPAATLLRGNDPSVDLPEIFRSGRLNLDVANPHVDEWINIGAYAGSTAGPGIRKFLPGDERHDSSVSSFCLIREEPISLYALELLLSAVERNIGSALLRLKGLVNIVEHPDRPAVLQGAQHLLHNLQWLERWPDADRRTRIVFIAVGIDRQELEEMVSTLDRIAHRTALAKQNGRAAGSERGARLIS